MTISKPAYDAVVIGLGPVGAVAARLLSMEGLSVLAVEPSLRPYDKPRAVGIDHEALRVLQRLSITEELSGFLGFYRPSEYRSGTGQLLRRIVQQPKPYPLSWPPYSTFIQPELERLLYSSFSNSPSLDIALGWSFYCIDQHNPQAKIVLKNASDGTERKVSSHYVVACDGASSPVREAIGSNLNDLGFDEPWLVVDILVNETATLPDAIVQYCDPARPCTFIHGPGELRRWELMLLPGENAAEMLRDDNIWRLLSKWLTPTQGRIWRAATYRFHALVCHEWRNERFFLAGDAAHQMPPFMAQGLNQGIRDVLNLCWKIGQVHVHNAHPSLLDTYEKERKPNVQAVIELTKTLGKLICERDPIAAAKRDQQLLSEMSAGKGDVIRQALLPPLLSGFLLKEANGDLSSGVGTIFPQPFVKTAFGLQRMDDVVQARFLMVVSSHWKPTAADLTLAKSLGVTIASPRAVNQRDGVIELLDESELISDWMSKHGLNAALVRPDHIVFGVANTQGSECVLLQRLKCALETPQLTDSTARGDDRKSISSSRTQ